MKKKFNYLIVLFSFNLFAQEIDCNVIVNSNLVDQTNQKIFKTLEKSLSEFINTNVWTDKKRLVEEKTSCSLIINLTNYSSSNFQGTFQIQLQRPIFNSNYDSPILNLLDKDISFSYQEFQPLFFNSSIYESNLISLISYYIYIILGLEADSLKINSGTIYYNHALKILNLAQQNNYKGWNQIDGNRNRFWLIDSLLSNTYFEFRTILYSYHRQGLDIMIENPVLAKNNILKSLMLFEDLHSRRPDSYLIKTFFDAKSNEIVDIFSNGPKVKLSKAIKTLNKVAPFFGAEWKKINY
ncbi:MAG: DUF4835 family protein [Flavobacteriaceae bacterium]|nr:DUF4835 family protein [Flavobacteriaceae bacterium]